MLWMQAKGLNHPGGLRRPPPHKQISCGLGTDVSVPISFCRGSSCHRPQRRQLGLSPEPGAGDHSTGVCCPRAGLEPAAGGTAQAPRHP